VTGFHASPTSRLTGLPERSRVPWIEKATSQLGIGVPAGLHTGEVRLANGDVEGIAVHIASRVTGFAGASQVMVTRTVRDLVAGSGISFSDVGLKPSRASPSGGSCTWPQPDLAF
jgi:class 3 adenylate cyclase